jgi:hypothetical protein
VEGASCNISDRQRCVVKSHARHNHSLASWMNANSRVAWKSEGGLWSMVRPLSQRIATSEVGSSEAAV